ncbi:MAG TPA: hypothetical protein DCQ93_01485 [Bacteroidetes bacterium]|nr:hypothetical protein [Bacteroidota bacterium]
MKDHKENKADSHSTDHAAPSSKINWLPYAVSILSFVAITFLYFSPMFTNNMALEQSDIIQGQGASKELADYRAANGKEALWTNSMFGGMPSYQVSTVYHGNFLRYIDSILSGGFPHPAELMFIMLLGFFFLLLAFEVNPWLSIIGAIGFSLSTYNLTLFDAGHNSKLGAMGYMPMVLAGTVMVYRNKKYLLGGVLTALAVSLEVKANHLQIAYYLFFILLAYSISELVQAIIKKGWKHYITASAVLVIAGVFGVLSNLSLLWTTSEYAGETIRGKSELTTNTKSSGGLDEDYALQYSYGKMESLTLLIPGFYGGSNGENLGSNSSTEKTLKEKGIPDENITNFVHRAPLYWGELPITSGPAYFGAIICFLFVLGMFLIKDNIKWWLLGICGLALMLAWGYHFKWLSDIFFHYFPAYNKFRTVEMILVIPQLCVSLFAVLTLNAIIRKNYDPAKVARQIQYSFYITGGICLFIAVLGSTFFDFTGLSDSSYPDWLVKALKEDRISLMRMDSFRSLIFISLAFGAIWFYVKGKISSSILIASVTLLTFIDLFMVGKRYLNDDKFTDKSALQNYFQPSQADQRILMDKSPDFRVLNLTGNPFNDGTTSYFHKSVGGYSAAKLRRYQELYDYQIQKQNISIVDMLNTRYMIVSEGENKPPQAQPNYGALGNCWFVDSVKVVADADEELNRIGNMYEVAALDGKSFTINGKQISKAIIGNHDKASIEGADLDFSRYGFSLEQSDTFSVSMRMNKETGKEENYITKTDSSGRGSFSSTLIYTFHPKTFAVVDKRFESQVKSFIPSVDSARNIRLVSYQPNDLVYESNSSKEGIAVFSEIYYNKGWNVWVNDKPAEYFRCNYVLRGMKLPAGKNKIEWKFEPTSYFTGEKIAMVSSVIILLLLIGVVGMEMRKRFSN